MRLQNKVALITGRLGASGIGYYTSLLFAQEGAAVVVADVNDEGGSQTVSDIVAAGGKAVYIHADVSKAADCEAMVAAAEKNFGKLNILFNNAGIMMSADDDAVSTEKVGVGYDDGRQRERCVLWLQVRCSRPAAGRSGSIINTAPFVALVGAATPQLAYTASKGAVLSMTRELATIHARENIRVNALCPGPLRTELLMKFLNTEEKKQRRLVHVPMGRFGEAKEMAYAALYLASDKSSYVTGTEFLVDGGITSAYVTPQ